MDSNCLALGNKSGSFCEAVNCEQSEQEGKFLFATIWFPDLLKPHGTMQGKARRAVVPFIKNITMEMNFSSKVYSKSLQKVGSL